MFLRKITLTEADKNNIKTAVEDLEKESSGEVVLYLAKQSDDYSDAMWYLAALLGFFSSLLCVTLSYFWLLPSDFNVFEFAIFIAACTLIGFLFPFLLPRLRVILMNDSSVTQRVATRAHDVFLQEEVFNTRDRSGILFYISALEHKVFVLADKGISAKVEEEQWVEVVKHIIQGIKKKQIADGVVQAVGDCKKLLLDNGFVMKPGDHNELRDEIISEFQD